MLAAFTRDPEIKDVLRMPHEEARDLARKAAEVSRHYKLPAINPGHVALAAFGAAAFKSYKARFVAIRAIQARRAAEGQTTAGTGREPAAHADDPFAAPAGAGASWMPPLN